MLYLLFPPPEGVDCRLFLLELVVSFIVLDSPSINALSNPLIEIGIA
jgi:hypothetical protein